MHQVHLEYRTQNSNTAPLPPPPEYFCVWLHNFWPMQKKRNIPPPSHPNQSLVSFHLSSWRVLWRVTTSAILKVAWIMQWFTDRSNQAANGIMFERSFSFRYMNALVNCLSVNILQMYINHVPISSFSQNDLSTSTSRGYNLTSEPCLTQKLVTH